MQKPKLLITKEEASRILDPQTQYEEFKKDISNWGERVDTAMLMGAEALVAGGKETSIVMRTRHQFRGQDYKKPYCGACDRYVPDANVLFCCWCGAKFVPTEPTMPEDVK